MQSDFGHYPMATKAQKMTGAASISIEEIAGRRALEIVEMIDVRTPAEFRSVHAAGARNVPLFSLDPQAVMAQRTCVTEPLYLICQSGSRGASACRKFHEAGYPNVVNVEGGTEAWLRAGLPVVRGQQTISLERQVRIVAGSLVLLGAVLGLLVHPYFVALSAFVGAGLVFAGITNTCGMAMILARMPWNQVPDLGRN